MTVSEIGNRIEKMDEKRAKNLLFRIIIKKAKEQKAFKEYMSTTNKPLDCYACDILDEMENEATEAGR